MNDETTKEAGESAESLDSAPNGGGANGAAAEGAEDATSETAVGGESATGSDLQQQLDAALREAEEHKENYLRAAAEMENQRRRSEKKIAEAHQYALTDFALAVGEVRDCLEAAVDDASDAAKLHEGVALTLRKLVAAMDTRHILPIKPDIGVMFDPTMHMAIGQLPATEAAAADTVAAIVQPGYMLNGRVIRAASVMVAAEVAPPAAQSDGGGTTESDTTEGSDAGKENSGAGEPA